MIKRFSYLTGASLLSLAVLAGGPALAQDCSGYPVASNCGNPAVVPQGGQSNGSAPVEAEEEAEPVTPFGSSGFADAVDAYYDRGFADIVVVDRDGQPNAGMGDGINDALEIVLGMDPNNVDNFLDGDGDFIPDNIDPDPANADVAPFDQLAAVLEGQLGYDPRTVDSDGDGISDFEELTSKFTNPNNPDTDGDGVPDGLDNAPRNPAAQFWRGGPPSGSGPNSDRNDNGNEGGDNNEPGTEPAEPGPAGTF